jgi:hypothetical protein
MYCYVESYNWMARQTFLWHTWHLLIWSRISKRKWWLRNVWNWSQNGALSYSIWVQSSVDLFSPLCMGEKRSFQLKHAPCFADTGNTLSSDQVRAGSVDTNAFCFSFIWQASVDGRVMVVCGWLGVTELLKCVGVITSSTLTLTVIGQIL